ncbi:MAG: LacI family DNA-binding transcriptional regulator, partial [Halopseudomonas sp.]
MAAKKVTIKELATFVGVNISTVSRAMDPDKRKMISPEVIKKVLGAADELGYVPNRMAYALKKNRSMMVGVLVPDITNPVFPPMISGIQAILDEAGYTTIAVNSDNKTDYELAAITRMREVQVDGLILATSHRQDPVVDKCLKYGTPLVLINRTTDRQDVNCVINDDRLGIEQAIEYLAGLGHSRIVHIAGPQDTSTGFERRVSYQTEMSRRCLTVLPGMIEETAAFTISEGYRA